MTLPISIPAAASNEATTCLRPVRARALQCGQALRALACDIAACPAGRVIQQDLFAVAEESEDLLIALDTTKETTYYNAIRPMTLVGVFTSKSRFR